MKKFEIGRERITATQKNSNFRQTSLLNKNLEQNQSFRASFPAIRLAEFLEYIL